MKLTKILLIMMLSITCLAGCKSNDATNENTDVKPNVAEEVNKTDLKVIASSQLPEKISDWTELDRYTGDVDKDGVDEDVILMTSAQRSIDKEIIWDDGQEWILYVKDRDLTYVLLNSRIQAGNAYFEVLDYYMKTGAEPRINLIISTGAGFKINSYMFDNDKEAYIEEKIYDTAEITEGGTNRRYSSVPDIIE